MNQYFDHREQRFKTLPDCGRHGLAWNHESQRCERTDILGMPVVVHVRHDDQEWTGLGFLPGATTTGAAVGGPIGAVIGTVVGAIASVLGIGFGPPSSGTSYRPPANTTQDFVQIDEPTGPVRVAYDINPQTLAIAAARDNKAADIYSYYSAFISNSTSAGASDAAKRVLEDASRTYGISIRTAADWLLNGAGIPRIVQAFLPGQSGQTGQTTAPTGLPPYCPVGTYHPYPIGHPEQDLCIPFPTGSGGQQSGGTMPAPSISKTVAATATGILGHYLSRKSGTYRPIPPCPQGQVFDQVSEQCVTPGQLGSGQSLESLFAGTPWWLWGLLALLVALALSDGEDRQPTTRRPKR